MRKVTISTSWLIRLLRKSALTGLTTENELLELPINRWSYSIPADQFGAKPYSQPTPTVPPQRVALAAASSLPPSVAKTLKRLSCYCRAALEVKQRSVPGIPDLTGEEAHAIGFGAGRELDRLNEADARVAEISPIALGFHTENPLAGLPTVTDLATDHPAGPITAALTEDRSGQGQRNPNTGG